MTTRARCSVKDCTGIVRVWSDPTIGLVYETCDGKCGYSGRQRPAAPLKPPSAATEAEKSRRRKIYNQRQAARGVKR